MVGDVLKTDKQGGPILFFRNTAGKNQITFIRGHEWSKIAKIAVDVWARIDRGSKLMAIPTSDNDILRPSYALGFGRKIQAATARE